MKLYVISDIHGCINELDSFIEYIKNDDFDNLIILGDICHGYGHNASLVGNILSKVTTRLILLKGNCDLPEDEKFLPTGFKDTFSLMINGHHIYFAHGHRYFPFGILKENDIYCHGHTHINMIEKVNDYFICCPGSISAPRCGTEKSYLLIENDTITLYNLNHEIIKQTKISTN